MATAREVYRYAFRTLFDEMSYWLVLGIVLSGVIAAALPQTFFEQYLTGEFTSMIVMLLIGIPIYTCASSSTPIAAALVLKGLNPGAALVFLLAGPATNIGSLIVLLKFLGARIVAIYLTSIVVITLLAGFTLNWIYGFWDLDAQASFGTGTEFLPETVKIAGAVALIALLLASMWRAHVPGEWVWLRDKFADLTGVALSAGRLRTATGAAVGLLYLATGLFTVQPGEVGIKTRFGRITAAELGPGLHYRRPWPFEDHRIVQKDLVQRVELGFRSTAAKSLAERALARKRLTVGGPSNPVPMTIQSRGFWFQKEKVAEESFLLTGDINLLDVSFTVHYRVRDPVAYAYDLTDPEALVRSLTLATLRATVGTTGIDAIYTVERGAIEDRVMASVQELLDRHRSGIELVSVRLLYVHPPEEVHPAFRDVASAQEDKIHIMNRAMTFAVEKVNLAEGDAVAMVEEALAFKEEKILRAEGDAAAFALKVEEYRRAPEITRFRLHLEAVEDVLPRVRKFLRPGADDLKELDLWLLDPFAAGNSQ
jgi:HflK protein